MAPGLAALTHQSSAAGRETLRDEAEAVPEVQLTAPNAANNSPDVRATHGRARWVACPHHRWAAPPPMGGMAPPPMGGMALPAMMLPQQQAAPMPEPPPLVLPRNAAAARAENDDAAAAPGRRRG